MGTTPDRTGNTRLLRPKPIVSIQVRVEHEDHFRILRTRARRLVLGGLERPLLEPYRGAEIMWGDPALRSLLRVSSTRHVVQCTRRRSSGSDRGAVRALRGVDTPLTTTHKDSSSSNPEPRCLKTPQSNLKRRGSRRTGPLLDGLLEVDPASHRPAPPERGRRDRAILP